MKLSEASIQRPVLATVMSLAILLFGVLSFSVAQRTREIGVRSALGAQARDIIGLVVRQALWIVGIGVLFGLAAALSGPGVARTIRAVSNRLHSTAVKKIEPQITKFRFLSPDMVLPFL